MTTEEVNELRIFALSAGQFVPLLERKKAIALGQLIQHFNSGGDTMRDLAKVAALTELEDEVKRKLRQLNAIGNTGGQS